MATWDPRANDLFLKALDLRSPGARQEYLDGACAGDAAVRAEVEALLAASASAGRFLESAAPAPDPVATVDAQPSSERPGTVVGPYKLLEQIGEGGFGVVFMAEQQQPLRRKVAVKVIKPGMDSRQVIARFEAERQALALMDHPNIAHVLDAGQAPSGRPYFAMELVRGVPVTAYCDQAGLTPRERLGLFVTVCRAVQHAHHKGIIHRDLKPSNVLVTLHDGTPVVKVIDFGIAKAIGQQLTEKTLFTGFAQMIGTPMYLSPEQTGLSGLDVDTRSDIYSLGVLLYELLTGTVPFDQERLRQVDFDELRRIIREEEPPRPSTRLSTLGQAATAVAAQRQSDPKRLGQLCRGELDWIVMKALEKDRNRRYDTASAFAADVQRYLDDEPVTACPASRWYRLRKVLRKHRGALSAVALVVVALVAGSVISTWQAIRANRAENDAVAQRDLALQAEERARTLVHRLRTLGEKHAETRQSASDLALALENRGDLAAAAGTYASWGFWTDAARSYRGLMQAQPGNNHHWWAFAIVSLARDDRESYRRTCQDMLDRFGDAGGTVDGARVAWVCSLQPDAGVDLQAARKLVDPPFGDLSRAALAALYYRTGQYSRAVEEFEKEGISASPPGFLAIVWCFRAMAYHRSGAHEKAREWLAKADQVVEENGATARWNHQVLFHVIREEAAGVTGVPAEPESPGTSTRPTPADREK
jgi:serine/threonine protein kinase